MYPEIIPLIHNYIQQNSAAAHLRRRDDVMYTNGVTLRDIASHVKKELNISVSKDTIHRFLKPVKDLNLTLMHVYLQSTTVERKKFTATFIIHVPK